MGQDLEFISPTTGAGLPPIPLSLAELQHDEHDASKESGLLVTAGGHGALPGELTRLGGVPCPAPSPPHLWLRRGMEHLDTDLVWRQSFFAHEEMWLFLCYLNVLLKCLPAIVAKPLSFIVRGVKKD